MIRKVLSNKVLNITVLGCIMGIIFTVIFFRYTENRLLNNMSNEYVAGKLLDTDNLSKNKSNDSSYVFDNGKSVNGNNELQNNDGNLPNTNSNHGKELPNELSMKINPSTHSISDEEIHEEEHRQKAEKIYELRNRLQDITDIDIQLSRFLASTSDLNFSNIVSAFKLFTPEQLESIRRNALKTVPSEEVNTFFDEIDKALPKTVEELRNVDLDVKQSLAIYEVMQQELNNEFNQVQRELRELHGDDYDQVYQKRVQQIKDRLKSEGSILADVL